ncbi:hypothetical protein PQ610_05855 [Tardisphaera miroshnichenkoae]
MKLVLFEDVTKGMAPLNDITPTYELVFGTKKLRDFWSSKLPGLKVELAGRWDRPSKSDEDLFLLNSLAVGAEEGFSKTLEALAKGNLPDEKGMVEGRRLVYAYISKQDVEAVMPFIDGWLDEQDVGAIGQKVMPIRTTHTIYDDLMRRNQPKVLVDTSWEFLAKSLDAISAQNGGNSSYVARSVDVVESKIENSAVAIGPSRVVNSTIRNSIIAGPALIENSTIENSYVGSYTVISNAHIRGLIGGLCVVGADVIGAKVGSGSLVLKELQKDVKINSRWGVESSVADELQVRLKRAFSDREISSAFQRLQTSVTS